MTDVSTITAVPPGTAILHIGPHKTGTTMLQSALHVAREELAAQGVRYASRGRHDGDASRYVLGIPVRHGGRGAGEAQWRGVVEALTDHRFQRRIFSSETLSNADEEAVARATAPLDAVHVVMVARSLVSLIPSQYQQLVQRGAVVEAFLPWVEAVLGRRSDIDATAFWRRHRLQDQLRRWGAVVGLENVSVLVLDESDPAFLAVVFERLLGVGQGTLIGKAQETNRSLSLDQVELLRSWHRLAREAGVSKRQRREYVLPIIDQLQQLAPDPDARRLTLPEWAASIARREGAVMAAAIAASGVRVIGDLQALSRERTSCPRPRALSWPRRLLSGP